MVLQCMFTRSPHVVRATGSVLHCRDTLVPPTNDGWMRGRRDGFSSMEPLFQMSCVPTVINPVYIYFSYRNAVLSTQTLIFALRTRPACTSLPLVGYVDTFLAILICVQE